MASALASHDGKYKCNGLHDNYHYLHIVAKEDGTATPTITTTKRRTSHPAEIAVPSISITTMTNGLQWKRGDTSQEEPVDEYYEYEDYEMEVARLRNSTSSADVEDYEDYAMSGDYSEGAKEETLDGDRESGELLGSSGKSGTSARNRLKGLIRTTILFADYDEASNFTTAAVPGTPTESTNTVMVPIVEEMTANGGNERFPGTSVAQSDIDRWSWKKTNDTLTEGSFNGSSRKLHFEREWPDPEGGVEKDLTPKKEFVQSWAGGGGGVEPMRSATRDGASSTSLPIDGDSRNIENLVVKGVRPDDAVLVGENFTIRCDL